MKVEVNYTKDVTCCKECPYYFQEHDMGATIPICTKSEEITILSSPNIIPNDCPIDEIKVKPFDTLSIGKEIKCNCVDETTDINNAIKILKIVLNCWADQVPNDGEKISDADAIKQSIRCLEEYLESNEKVKNANH